MNKLQKYYLKDIAISQTGPFGSQLHEKDYVKKGTPIVTVEHLGEIGFILDNLPMVSDEDKKRLSKYILKEGDIVFSRVGSVDRCTYVSKNEDGWMFSGRCLRIRFNEKANSRYLSFYFRQKHFKEMMLNISVGATMPSLNTSLMDNIPVFLPLLSEQKIIAEFLSTLDSKIELNNRFNNELSALAKTIYDYWFVQFDFPNEEGRPYKSNKGKMVLAKELNREIPVGWKIENLKNNSLSELIKPGINNFDGEKKYLATADVLNDVINFNANKVTFENRGSRANMQPRENSVWFAKMKNSKKVLYIGDYSKEYLNNYILSTGFAGLICKEYAFEYIWNFTNDDNFEFIKDRLANGATQEAINNESMSFIRLVVPPKDVLENFQKATHNIYKFIYTNQIENQKLAEFRDWILPMLMNGQVKVE